MYTSMNQRLGLYGTKPWVAVYPVYMQYSAFENGIDQQKITDRVNELKNEKSDLEAQIEVLKAAAADWSAEVSKYCVNYNVKGILIKTQIERCNNAKFSLGNINEGIRAKSNTLNEVNAALNELLKSGIYEQQINAQESLAKSSKVKTSGAVVAVALVVLGISIYGIIKYK